jgi:hypothetical protein
MSSVHALRVGVRVHVVKGLTAGNDGTVVKDEGVSPIGIRLWRVDLDGLRMRTIREDYLAPLPISTGEGI